MPSYRTIPRNCEACGREFQARASIIKLGKGRFCSDACRKPSRSRPKATTTKQPCVCERCGTVTMKTPSAIAAGRGRFCGKTCQNAAQENKVTLPCETCGKPVTRKASAMKERVFCSRTCDLTKHAQPIITHEDGLTASVPLLNRAGEVIGHTLIDAADAEWVGQWTWNLSQQGQYAVRGDGVKLHRELLGLTRGDGIEGDHINHNTLDNRRSNLRAGDDDMTAQNTSRRKGSASSYRGVAWYPKTGKWVAYCSVGGKRHHLGYFLREEDAAEAAREARKTLMPFAME